MPPEQNEQEAEEELGATVDWFDKYDEDIANGNT